MAAYRTAKARILEFQASSDVVVLGRDDTGAWSLASEARGQLFSFGLSPLPVDKAGTFLWDEIIYMRSDVRAEVKTSTGQLRPGPNLKDISLAARQDIALRGEHNLLNVMAACTIAVAVGLPVEAIWAGIRGFTGIPHRLEFIRSWGGADWYNDSIATAPERAIAAIRSFEEPLIVLAGGRDKDLLWDDFASLVLRRVEHLILFGEAAELIYQAVTSIGDGSLKITRCDGLNEAVWAASQVVRPGDVVLLSPGGTSFDEFKDFEERGECFAQWVRELT
jgi:UDP-N-acetylmuramoylalanine--D-glutamate ligase